MNKYMKLLIWPAMSLLVMLSGCSGNYKSRTISGALAESDIRADFNPSQLLPSPVALTLQKGTAINDTVEIDVAVKDMGSVFGASIKIAYDAEKLEWTGSYRRGEFLEKSGSLPNYQVALDGADGEGRLIIGVSLIYPAQSVSGSGTIVTIPFKVISRGISNLSIYDSIIADSSANAIATITDYKVGTITGF